MAKLIIRRVLEYIGDVDWLDEVMENCVVKPALPFKVGNADNVNMIRCVEVTIHECANEYVELLKKEKE